MLQKRFPPLPPALRDWFAIHEMIEQHGQKSFKPFLAEMKAGTLAYQDAVTDYVDVEYFENIREQANKIMEDTKAEAAAIHDSVQEIVADARAKATKAHEKHEAEKKTDKAAHGKRIKAVEDRERESARREEALSAREKETQASVQRMSDAQTRIDAKQAELDKHLADFEKVKALLG